MASFLGRPLRSKGIDELDEQAKSSGNFGGNAADGMSRQKLKAKQEKVVQKRADGTVAKSRGENIFHGAFTGGFSAGYFNTVGTKEGYEDKNRFVSIRGGQGNRKLNSGVKEAVEREGGAAGGSTSSASGASGASARNLRVDDLLDEEDRLMGIGGDDHAGIVNNSDDIHDDPNAGGEDDDLLFSSIFSAEGAKKAAEEAGRRAQSNTASTAAQAEERRRNAGSYARSGMLGRKSAPYDPEDLSKPIFSGTAQSELRQKLLRGSRGVQEKKEQQKKQEEDEKVESQKQAESTSSAMKGAKKKITAQDDENGEDAAASLTFTKFQKSSSSGGGPGNRRGPLGRSRHPKASEKLAGAKRTWEEGSDEDSDDDGNSFVNRLGRSPASGKVDSSAAGKKAESAVSSSSAAFNSAVSRMWTLSVNSVYFEPKADTKGLGYKGDIASKEKGFGAFGSSSSSTSAPDAKRRKLEGQKSSNKDGKNVNDKKDASNKNKSSGLSPFSAAEREKTRKFLQGKNEAAFAGLDDDEGIDGGGMGGIFGDSVEYDFEEGPGGGPDTNRGGNKRDRSRSRDRSRGRGGRDRNRRGSDNSKGFEFEGEDDERNNDNLKDVVHEQKIEFVDGGLLDTSLGTRSAIMKRVEAARAERARKRAKNKADNVANGGTNRKPYGQLPLDFFARFEETKDDTVKELEELFRKQSTMNRGILERAQIYGEKHRGTVEVKEKEREKREKRAKGDGKRGKSNTFGANTSSGDARKPGADDDSNSDDDWVAPKRPTLQDMNSNSNPGDNQNQNQQNQNRNQLLGDMDRNQRKNIIDMLGSKFGRTKFSSSASTAVAGAGGIISEKKSGEIQAEEKNPQVSGGLMTAADIMAAQGKNLNVTNPTDKSSSSAGDPASSSPSGNNNQNGMFTQGLAGLSSRKDLSDAGLDEEKALYFAAQLEGRSWKPRDAGKWAERLEQRAFEEKLKQQEVEKQKKNESIQKGGFSKLESKSEKAKKEERFAGVGNSAHNQPFEYSEEDLALYMNWFQNVYVKNRKKYMRRTYNWQPNPFLCRKLNLLNPYKEESKNSKTRGLGGWGDNANSNANKSQNRNMTGPRSRGQDKDSYSASSAINSLMGNDNKRRDFVDNRIEKTWEVRMDKLRTGDGRTAYIGEMDDNPDLEENDGDAGGDGDGGNADTQSPENQNQNFNNNAMQNSMNFNNNSMNNNFHQNAMNFNNNMMNFNQNPMGFNPMMNPGMMNSGVMNPGMINADMSLMAQMSPEMIMFMSQFQQPAQFQPGGFMGQNTGGMFNNNILQSPGGNSNANADGANGSNNNNAGNSFSGNPNLSFGNIFS